MKGRKYWILAAILGICGGLLGVANASVDKPETREKFEQKVKQQQAKIKELETIVSEQKKQILDLEWQIYHLKHKPEPDEIERPEEENREIKQLQNIIKDSKAEIARLKELCHKTVIVTEAAAAKKKEIPKSTEKEKSVVDALSKDAGYSAIEGSGGSYKDPINGYFEVQPPVGFQIKERRDKSKFTITDGSSHVGDVVPQSFIQFIFPKEKAFIAVIARKTFVTIGHDFEFLLKDFPRRFPGIKINRSRFVTIDGVKGMEVFASWRTQKLFIVKYKKHGLDHSITINCDIADFSKFEDKFVAFLRSYRSLNLE